MRELQELAEALEVKVLKPANLEGTRWMPHLSRALAVLLKSYKVFVSHFEDTVQGCKRTADVQGRARNILQHLKSQKLLHYMFFLRDVLAVLSDLSLQFQKDACTIPDALEVLETACLRLVGLQQRPGSCLQAFLDACQQQTFKGVELTPMDLTEEQLNTKKRSLKNRLSDLETSETVRAMQVFFISNLHETDDELATYGEEEIEALCDYFQQVLTRLECAVEEIPATEWPALKAHMRRHHQLSNETLYHLIFTNEHLKDRFKNIIMLVEIILGIPTSSAICECGFSAMARIKSDWRATLGPEMLDYLMAISISGPQVCQYNCERALALWFHGGQRQRRPQFNE